MDAGTVTFFLIFLIGVALLFDFLNGLHDAANSIATIVSTRVLRPQYAVLWAAFFNFIAFLFFGLHVAKTVGSGIVAPVSGALSGTAAVYDAVFQRYNIIQTKTPDELLDTVELFVSSRRPSAPGIGLGTDSGGERQLLADIATDIGLKFPNLTESTVAEIDGYLDPGMTPANPLDYWGDGGDVMAPCLIALAKDPSVGTVVMASNMPSGRPFLKQCATAITTVHDATEKPVVLMGNMSSTMSPDMIAHIRAYGIPVLMGTETSLRAIKHFLNYSERVGIPEKENYFDVSPLAQGWLNRFTHSSDVALSSVEGFRLLSDYGLDVPPFIAIEDANQLEEFGNQFGYPIVIKIDDPKISHKTEVGGVLTGIGDPGEALIAYTRLGELHPHSPIIAQSQVKGAELILGMTTDADFGPILTIGFGGIYTEVFKDVSLLLPPVDAKGARQALMALRSFPLLNGVRGASAVAIDRVVSTIVAFSHLISDLANQVSEIEINPLIVNSDRAVAVDCLVLTKSEAKHGK